MAGGANGTELRVVILLKSAQSTEQGTVCHSQHMQRKTRYAISRLRPDPK